MKKRVLTGLIALIGFICFFAILAAMTPTDTEEKALADETEASSTEESEVFLPGSGKLSKEQTALIEEEVQIEDVPMLNQLDSPRLRNGCEITALAMLLNFHDVEVTKNELAEEIHVVDYQNEDGNYGDPNEGFVGDMTGDYGAGYFVYHEPIFEVAVEQVPDDMTVIDFSGGSFEEIQYYLSIGSPVWVITTTNYAATNDLETWNTENGDVEISMSEHSVLLTGYDETSVYLNDPYGNENYQTDLKDFVASWEQMDSQAITIIEA